RGVVVGEPGGAPARYGAVAAALRDASARGRPAGRAGTAAHPRRAHRQGRWGASQRAGRTVSLSIPQAHERPGTAGAAVIAIDLALRAGWKRLPDPATAWAARHRTRMVVGATLVIPVALNPAALLLVAVTAY